MKIRVLSLLIVGAWAVSANAASIYVFRTGDPAHDTTVMNALTSQGHSPFLGQLIGSFTNLSVLNGYEAVYYQPNYQWTTSWTSVQEQALIDYANGGGGVVSCEWALWMAAAGYSQTLKSIFPAVETTGYDGAGSISYAQATADPIMNAGLAGTFGCNTVSIAGVRTYVTAQKAGATTFYTDQNGYKAVVGWNVGNGRSVNFHTVNGGVQLIDPEFRTLLGNSFEWVTNNPPTGPGVTGHLNFSDWTASSAPTSAAFLYFNESLGIGAGRVSGTSTSGGDYTTPGPNVPGTYRLYVKSSHWLRASTLVTTSSSGTVTASPITLINGDCDGDNEVGPGDFGTLSAAFGAADGDWNWNVEADLDGDEEVGPSDFGILASNFGEAGE